MDRDGARGPFFGYSNMGVFYPWTYLNLVDSKSNIYPWILGLKKQFGQRWLSINLFLSGKSLECDRNPLGLQPQVEPSDFRRVLLTNMYSTSTLNVPIKT